MKTLPKQIASLFSLIVLSVTVTACNRQETPAQTRADVSEAQREGANDVAEERREASRDMNNSSADRAEETAEGNREVALAEAKAEHKIATERCEAMSGGPRTNCKKQADIVLDRAKTRADNDESASRQ